MNNDRIKKIIVELKRASKSIENCMDADSGKQSKLLLTTEILDVTGRQEIEQEVLMKEPETLQKVDMKQTRVDHKRTSPLLPSFAEQVVQRQ